MEDPIPNQSTSPAVNTISERKAKMQKFWFSTRLWLLLKGGWNMMIYDD